MATLIMVVEDERILAMHLRQQLTKLGYQVVGIVSSGQAALTQAAELHPEVMLMDINIEGEIDGIETATRLPQELEVAVVFLSAYSEETTLARARAANPYGYLVKPFEARSLHATIQVALQRRAVDLALQGREQRLRLALEAAERGAAELALANARLQAQIIRH